MGVGPKLSGGSISGRLIIEPVDDHTIIMAVSYQYNNQYDINEL